MLNGWACLPGQNAKGGCLPFAIAYCQGHPGSQLIIAVRPRPGAPANLEAHAFVHTAAGYLDNLHPRPDSQNGRSALGFMCSCGMNGIEWHIYRVINYDCQSAEDRHIIEVLKKTAGA
jgi:hypothetical protein